MDKYENLINNLHSMLGTTKFKSSKITGSKVVAEYMTEPFVKEMHSKGLIDTEERDLLMQVFYTKEQNIPRGTKTKIRNVLNKKIGPYISGLASRNTKVNQDSQDSQDVDLNLPEVKDILDEVRKDKLPIGITGRVPKSFSGNTDINKESNTETKESIPDGLKEVIDNTSSVKKKDKREVENSKEIEYIQKDIVTDDQKTLIRQLRNKLYSKDKIEIFPNQSLDTFIVGDDSLKNTKVDLVICDKNTFNIVCVVVIVDEVKIDETAILLNKLNIKRLVIKRENSILNNQDIRALEEEINNRFAPICSKCGLSMVQKENIKTRHRFYACIDNQNCRFTIDMGD